MTDEREREEREREREREKSEVGGPRRMAAANGAMAALEGGRDGAGVFLLLKRERIKEKRVVAEWRVSR